MLDLVAIAQSAPGPIAVNGAIVVGYKLGGMPGILVSVLGAVLPPFAILSLVSVAYTFFKENFFVKAMLEGMTAGVSAVIVSVVWDMAGGIVKGRDFLLVLVMILAFLMNYVWKVNAIVIILAAVLLGLVRTMWRIHFRGQGEEGEKKK